MIVIMSQNWKEMSGIIRTYKAGAAIFHQNDKVTSMFQIVEGEARLTRRNRNGGTLVLQRATAGSILAEASLFATPYHCDAVAATDVNVRVFQRSALRRRFETDPAFAKTWVEHLALEIRAASSRAELLSLKTVSERLSAWLENHGPLPAKGNWKGLAHELGTSAEALYREVAKKNRSL